MPPPLEPTGPGQATAVVTAGAAAHNGAREPSGSTRPTHSAWPTGTVCSSDAGSSASNGTGVVSTDRPTFASRLRGHANAFGLFRLVMASMVIFSHAFYLGHWGEDPTLVWSNHQSDLGNLAVLGFFVISGYLIAKSAMSTNIMSYFWRRGLRIFPGFLVVLVVGAVILGPWFYYRLHGSMAGYWTWESPGPWTYVRDNASLKMRQYGVHDVLLQTPYGQRKEASVINGSLWTLWYEWRMYVIVGLLAFTGFTRPKLRWIIPVGTLAVFAAGVLSPHVPLIETVNYKIMGDVKGLQLASMFLVGSTVAVYADRIPFNRPVALIGGLVAVMTFFTAGFTTIGYVGMGYFVLWAAAAAPKSWYRIGTRNDISYGVYIYAWPTQMALAYFGGDTWGYIPYVAATFAITIPLAWLSWKLIENPMLHLKDAGPGKWGNQLTRWIKDRRARPSAPGSEYVEQDREPVKV